MNILANMLLTWEWAILLNDMDFILLISFQDFFFFSTNVKYHKVMYSCKV